MSNEQRIMNNGHWIRQQLKVQAQAEEELRRTKKLEQELAMNKRNTLKYITRCNDDCEVLLQETSNTIHYSCLRCKEHGFIKWLSYEQHDDLAKIMYPNKMNSKDKQ